MDYGHSSAEYRAYLRSPAWAERRRRYYAKHPRACATCGKRPVWRSKWWQVWKPKDWLVLHHVRYVNQRKNPGSEPDADLSPQCRSHHDEIHARHKAGAFAAHGDEALAMTTQWVIARNARKRAKLSQAPTRRSLAH